MRKLTLASLIVVIAVDAYAGSKDSGTANLKDVQTVGTTAKKQKNQQYDFIFSSATKDYTCRTKFNKKVNATDFVVGSELRYEINGDKAKVKSSGKQIDCTIVRVAALAAAQAN